MAEQEPRERSESTGEEPAETADDWQRIEPLFDRALDLLGAERERYLEHLKTIDPEAHARLEELLEAAGESGSMILDQPIEEAASSLVEKVPLDHWDAGLSDGDRIGGYRILRPLGGGGMGHVFIVEPLGGKEEQAGQLALKVLSRSRDREELRQRFDRERAILEGLRHPLILPLVDHGVTDDNRPYFVMRLLDGQSITDFCRERELRVADRLRLFLRLCDAVRHAHQRGVVHRDLKPSNVLVEVDEHGDAQPYVLDFGIAHEGETRDLTLTGQIMGTPGYMAPEQARGEIDRVDRRSDVFSLGAMLYELVTDEKAYRGRNAADTLIAVIEQPPPRVRDSHPQVHRDLDEIVHRAMAKDRAARYVSVGRLVDDLEDHLAGHPITRIPRPSQTGSLVEGSASWEELAAGRRLPRTAVRRAAPWAVATIALSAVLSMVWWWWLRAEPRPDSGRSIAINASADAREFAGRTSADLASEVSARLRFAHLAQLHDLQPSLGQGAPLLAELRRRSGSGRARDRLALIEALWARRDVERAGPLVRALVGELGSAASVELDLSSALSVLVQSCWDHDRLLGWWRELEVETEDLERDLRRSCRAAADRLLEALPSAEASGPGAGPAVPLDDAAVHPPLWAGDGARAVATAGRLVEARPWRFEVYLDLAAMPRVTGDSVTAADEELSLSLVRRAVQQGRSDPLALQRLCQMGSGLAAFESCRASLAADASRAWPRIEMLWLGGADGDVGEPAAGLRCGPLGRMARQVAAVAPHSLAAHLAVVRVCSAWLLGEEAVAEEAAASATVARQALTRARAVLPAEGAEPAMAILLGRLERRLDAVAR